METTKQARPSGNYVRGEYSRIFEICGDRRRQIPALLPISRTVWWEWVKSGKAPKPRKLTPKIYVWKTADVLAIVEGGSE